ncbi:MAG TPA: STAS domain-containing protein [Stellaceae bacterium]|jgi:stage II sporulation protein AA (anti-sigma F factor antagonist)|nr:STAS domain-containing protein [Stellaceae bacterium]
MEVQKEQRGDVTIVRPVGRINSGNAAEFELALNHQLDAGGRKLVLDLSHVDMISSAGLRVVLVIGKQLKTKSGKLVLAGLKQSVHEVFQISGFLTLFPVFPNTTQAALSFGA